MEFRTDEAQLLGLWAATRLLGGDPRPRRPNGQGRTLHKGRSTVDRVCARAGAAEFRSDHLGLTQSQSRVRLICMKLRGALAPKRSRPSDYFLGAIALLSLAKTIGVKPSTRSEAALRRAVCATCRRKSTITSSRGSPKSRCCSAAALMIAPSVPGAALSQKSRLLLELLQRPGNEILRKTGNHEPGVAD